MGNCCSQNTQGEKAEDFIRKQMLPMKQINNFNYKMILKETKEMLKDDCILIRDFLSIMESYWSTSAEKREFQEGLFSKYFKALGIKEMNVYEIILLAIPYLNMNEKDKKKLLNIIVNYLVDPETNIMNKNKKTKREIIFDYYNFHTCFLTKAFIFILNNKHNLMTSKSEEIKQKKLEKKKKEREKYINSKNHKYNTELQDLQEYSSDTSNSSQINEKDTKKLEMKKIIDELYDLQVNVFSEDNLKKEVGILFSNISLDSNDENKQSFMRRKFENDTQEQKAFSQVISGGNKKGDYENYECSQFYNENFNQMQGDSNTNKNFRGNSKMELLVFVDLCELRDYFIKKYKPKEDSTEV